MQLNNEAVAAFFRGGVENLPATAALGARYSRVQLVTAAKVFPEVERLAVAMTHRRDVTPVCSRNHDT